MVRFRFKFCKGPVFGLVWGFTGSVQAYIWFNGSRFEQFQPQFKQLTFKKNLELKCESLNSDLT